MVSIVSDCVEICPLVAHLLCIELCRYLHCSVLFCTFVPLLPDHHAVVLVATQSRIVAGGTWLGNSRTLVGTLIAGGSVPSPDYWGGMNDSWLRWHTPLPVLV